MPVLENSRHEKFAQLLFEGVKEGDAYVQVGYTKNPGNACRLKNDEKIQGRIRELHEKAADLSVYNKDWVIRELAANHRAAFDCGQHSASVGALKLIGVERGMFETKSKITINDPKKMSDEELAAFVASQSKG